MTTLSQSCQVNCTSRAVLPGWKGFKRLKVNDHNRKNSTKLDNDIKHIDEVFTFVSSSRIHSPKSSDP